MSASPGSSHTTLQPRSKAVAVRYADRAAPMPRRRCEEATARPHSSLSPSTGTEQPPVATGVPSLSSVARPATPPPSAAPRSQAISLGGAARLAVREMLHARRGGVPGFVGGLAEADPVDRRRSYEGSGRAGQQWRAVLDPESGREQGRLDLGRARRQELQARLSVALAENGDQCVDLFGGRLRAVVRDGVIGRRDGPVGVVAHREGADADVIGRAERERAYVVLDVEVHEGSCRDRDLGTPGMVSLPCAAGQADFERIAVCVEAWSVWWLGRAVATRGGSHPRRASGRWARYGRGRLDGVRGSSVRRRCRGRHVRHRSRRTPGRQGLVESGTRVRRC